MLSWILTTNLSVGRNYQEFELGEAQGIALNATDGKAELLAT
jgi:hypothetical protein